MSGSSTIWLTSLLAVGVASAIPLVATWWLATRPATTALWVPRLIFIASGALLGAALFHLIPEALAGDSAGRVVIFVALGVVALALLERAIHALERREDGVSGAAHEPHEPHEPHGPHGHPSHLMPLGIASDALHNTIDGALVATAFLADPSLGIFAGVAIALHELPRELGTFALCVDGGMSPRRAILVNAATGVLALLGAVSALLIGADTERFGAFLVPFAAGNFLYLSAAILVSRRRTAAPGRRRWDYAFALGGLLMTALVAGGH